MSAHSVAYGNLVIFSNYAQSLFALLFSLWALRNVTLATSMMVAYR